jgi:hypothetical protein
MLPDPGSATHASFAVLPYLQLWQTTLPYVTPPGRCADLVPLAGVRSLPEDFAEPSTGEQVCATPIPSRPRATLLARRAFTVLCWS